MARPHLLTFPAGAYHSRRLLALSCPTKCQSEVTQEAAREHEHNPETLRILLQELPAADAEKNPLRRR